jgi:hypothetical protein
MSWSLVCHGPWSIAIPWAPARDGWLSLRVLPKPHLLAHVELSNEPTVLDTNLQRSIRTLQNNDPDHAWLTWDLGPGAPGQDSKTGRSALQRLGEKAALLDQAQRSLGARHWLLPVTLSSPISSPSSRSRPES